MKKTIFLVLGLLFLYFLFINLMSILDERNPLFFSESRRGVGTFQDNAVFSETLSVQALRKTFLGTIYFNDMKSDFYLFERFKIPLRSNGENLIIYHITFLVFCVVLFIILSIKEVRK